MNAPRVVRREPLAVVLVVANLALAALLISRKFSSAPHNGLPPGHPDVSIPANLLAPVSEPAASAPSAALALSGVVKLSPALKDPWPAGAHVFVIARGEGGGPPYAVRRYDGVKPPFAFALGPDNLMIQGLPAPARLIVSARVDQDGDALTRQLGDLESAPTAPVPPRGAVELIIDRPVELVPTAGR